MDSIKSINKRVTNYLEIMLYKMQQEYFFFSGVGLATNSSSRQLKKECASILENIKVNIYLSPQVGTEKYLSCTAM